MVVHKELSSNGDAKAVLWPDSYSDEIMQAAIYKGGFNNRGLFKSNAF